MEEQDARLLVSHVGVNRHDVNPANANRFQCGLQFILSYGEISIDYGVVIRSGERRARIHAHRVVDLESMHRRRVADRELHHPVAHFAAHPENRIERLL